MRFSLVLTVATGICATAIASTTGSSPQLATANSGLELTSAGVVSANDVSWCKACYAECNKGTFQKCMDCKKAKCPKPPSVDETIANREASIAIAETASNDLVTRQTKGGKCAACWILCIWAPAFTCRVCKQYCNGRGDIGDLVEGIPTIGDHVEAGNNVTETENAVKAVNYLNCLGQCSLSDVGGCAHCPTMPVEGEVTGISEPLNTGLTQLASDTVDMLFNNDKSISCEKTVDMAKCFLCYTECLARPDLVKCMHCGHCEYNIHA